MSSKCPYFEPASLGALVCIVLVMPLSLYLTLTSESIIYALLILQGRLQTSTKDVSLSPGSRAVRDEAG